MAKKNKATDIISNATHIFRPLCTARVWSYNQYKNFPNFTHWTEISIKLAIYTNVILNHLLYRMKITQQILVLV